MDTCSSTVNGPFSPSNCTEDASDFECNICFELAQDPIVTLCGHLYCWPCLYKWLHFHSKCRECPVCKALIEEEKLVPLYGRGKTHSDPRTRAIPDIEVPSRPTGQRPETARGPDMNYFTGRGFEPMGEFMPRRTAGVLSLTLAAAIGGFIPALAPFLLNLEVQGFHGRNVYGATSGLPYGLLSSVYGGHAHWFHQPSSQREQSDSSFLKKLFLLLGFFVIFLCIFCT